MCKCKKAADAAKFISSSKSKGNSDVTVTVNVTDIVKYVALAGVAIVGIIFGTKCYSEIAGKQEKEDE
ncbi:MAG: hypothetical protein SO170_01155 [Butyribacter sp.]|nr:hypothetical protein [bacterium]MDY3853558.1 hypothetical protein [Butyribacter sp.]